MTPLHRAQRVGHVLGGPQCQVGAEQLTLLARSRVEQRRTARIPEPAAREEPEGRKRAPAPQPPARAPQPPAPAKHGGPWQGRHGQILGLRDGAGQTNHLLRFTAIRSSSPLLAWTSPDPETWPGMLDQLVYYHG